MVNRDKHVQLTSVNVLRGLTAVNTLSIAHLYHSKACTDLYNVLQICTNPSVRNSNSVTEVVYHGYEALTVA